MTVPPAGYILARLQIASTPPTDLMKRVGWTPREKGTREKGT
jgi:hypothetical protein